MLFLYGSAILYRLCRSYCLGFNRFGLNRLSGVCRRGSGFTLTVASGENRCKQYCRKQEY